MFVIDNIFLPLYTKIYTYIYILFQKPVVHTKLDIYFFNYFLNGEYFFINRTFQQLCLLQLYSSILKITYWNIIKWFICTDVVFHKSKKKTKINILNNVISWSLSNFHHIYYLESIIFLIKDWSQFFFGSWRNKLKNVVHTV